MRVKKCTGGKGPACSHFLLPTGYRLPMALRFASSGAGVRPSMSQLSQRICSHAVRCDGALAYIVT